MPWPAAEARSHQAAGLWNGSRLGDLLRPVAASAPDRIAVATRAARVTYGELDRRADRLAAGLWERGIRPGERLVVALPNTADFITVSVAAFRVGAIPVYALPVHRRRELTYLARHAGACALVVPDRHQDFDFRGAVAEIAEEVATVRHVLVAGDAAGHTPLAAVDAPPRELPAPDPQEVAFMLLSGGTTGMPKLIPRTHDDYALQLRLSAAAAGADASTVYLAALPIAHNAALGCPGALGTIALGGRLVLAGSPSPDEVFDLIAREQPTLTTAMPAFLTLWSEFAGAFGADLSGLTIEVGGAPLDPAFAVAAQARLSATITHWFGMAEGVLCCTRPGDPLELSARSQGRPVCDADAFRVLDPAGEDVAPGEVGELAVRGPMTLRGYYREPEYNARTFTSDGFLLTGDLVRFPPGGVLTVTGRVKDVINRGGEKISPGEVEDQLRAHPHIRDGALVAYPDRLLGEKSCAVLVIGDAAPSLGELRAFLSDRGLADYKLPDRLELVDALPLTKIGKVDKARLRAKLADPAPALP